MAPNKPKALPIDTSEGQTPRFVIFSVLIHVAAVVALIYVSAKQLTAPDEHDEEEVTIELTSGDMADVPMPQGEEVPPSEGVSTPEPPAPVVAATTKPAAPQPAAPQPAAPPSIAPVVKSAPVAVKSEPIAVPPPDTTPTPTTAKVAATNTPTVAESPVEVPASLDDIETPDLPEPIATVVPVKETSRKPKPDLQKINAQALAAAEELQNELSGAGSDLDGNALSEAEAQVASDANAMGSHLAAVKSNNQKALAEAQAAQAARAAQAAAAAKATAEKAGSGGGNEGQGGNASGVASAGKAGQIRGIESLRQMPGNPKPAYSEIERAQRQQGEVVFLAYVNKEGRLTDIKQTQSTGYSNLDSKTLASLQRWKFYPGQEGWVEIPFKWDIRGGAQEMSALNRSKLSQQME